MNAIQNNANKMIAVTGEQAHFPIHDTSEKQSAINELDLLQYAQQLHAKLPVHTSAITRKTLLSGIAFPYQGQTFFFKVKDDKLVVIDELGYLVIEGAIHAAQNIVHLYQGQPMTDSLTIAREFGRPHKNVLQSIDKLIEDGTIGRLEFKPSTYINEQNKTQRMIELNERGALIAMPFIGGKKSREGQVRLVDAFLALRGELVAQSVDWADSRQAVSTGFKAVMEALKETRAEVGKETLPCHYSNEARLINLVLFGNADGVDKANFSGADIKALEKVEAKDAYLIARGRRYPERKAALLKLIEQSGCGKSIKKISAASVRAVRMIKGVAR